MNRHLVVVELDARLFDAPNDTAGFVERAVARALQSEAPASVLPHVDLRPAVTCIAGPRGSAIRYIDSENADVLDRFDEDMRMLGLFSTGTLVAELAARAENGQTDRGLGFVTTVDA